MYKLPRRNLIWLRIITPIIIFFSLISILVASFFVIYIRTPVRGLSMYPTLNSAYEQTHENDIVYINRFKNSQKGDMVVLDLRNHAEFGDYAIKRLVAVEGDIVNIVFNTNSMQYELMVNSEIIYSRPHQLMGNNTYSCFNQYVSVHEDDETRIIKDEHGQIQGVQLKKGEIFVLGDNWDVSKDSSLVGPINKKTIVGRVDIVVSSAENEVWAVLKRIF